MFMLLGPVVVIGNFQHSNHDVAFYASLKEHTFKE